MHRTNLLPVSAIKRLMKHDSGTTVQVVTADAVDMMKVLTTYY